MEHQQKFSTSVTTAALADVGGKRIHQQDSLGYLTFPVDKQAAQLAAQKGHLYVVADGVGGAEAGGLASGLAVQTIIDSFYGDPSTDIKASLRAAIIQADEGLIEESEKRCIISMQSTVVCAVIRGQELYVAHAGDSRAYLMRSGELTRLTTDHSKVQALVQAEKLTPEEARTHPDRHLITRSLGANEPVEPEISRYEIRADDMLLLCSDGVHGKLPDEEIKSLLLANSNLPTVCEKAVRQAKKTGGEHNISLIVTRIDAIHNVVRSFADRILPLRLRDINHSTYTDLAPATLDFLSETERLAQKPSWQRKQALSLLGIMTLVFVILVTFQTILTQNVTNGQPRELDGQQEVLVEIDTLMTDYQKETYDDVNGGLLQK
ncbi:MAG: PP2C family protein-serine/threonine phosphatase [Ardenticatenaceae bacterium]